MVVYLDRLFVDGLHVLFGRYTLWGFILFFPVTSCSDRDRFPNSRHNIRQWGNRCLGVSRVGFALWVYWVAALHALTSTSKRSLGEQLAIAIIIHVGCYLRPSEAVDIDWASVTKPVAQSGRAAGKWTILIGDASLGSFTKTGLQDDTVIVGEIGRD